MRLWLDGKLVADDWDSHPLRYKGEKLSLRKHVRAGQTIRYTGQKIDVKL